MEIVVLFALVALLLFGPRRHGRPQGGVALVIGALFLVWLAIAFGFGWLFREIVGPIAQP